MSDFAENSGIGAHICITRVGKLGRKGGSVVDEGREREREKKVTLGCKLFHKID